MKRGFKSTVFLMIACGLLTIAAGMAWINNISIARQWHSDIMHNNALSKAGGDNDEIKEKMVDIGEKVYFGPFLILHGPARVDYSTMTTLIPFFGLLFMTVGFGRIAWKSNRERMRQEHFPFLRFYNGITVTLGLIGTIWGLIMIGYYHEPDVDDLTACLHTALFSTLIALVWVFLIALPVRYAMQWWDKMLYKVADPDDIGGVFNELTAAASGLGKNLTEASKGTGEFIENIIKSQERMTGITEGLNSTAERIDNTLVIFGKILASQSKLLEEQREENARNQEVRDTFLEALVQMQANNQELNAELKEEREARQRAEAKLRAIISTLGA